jgi:glycosyltransferase involved in cell wall biosynthesis
MNTAPPTILLSHPTGNANTRATADVLYGHQTLHSFHTCIAVGNDTKNPLKKSLFRQRRTKLPEARIVTHPWRELARLLSQKSGLFPAWRSHETGPFCIDQIYRTLDSSVAKSLRGMGKDAPAAVYAYEDGALSTFQAAAEMGLHRFYEQPIGYWRTARSLQREEAERRPEWRSTMPALIDSECKLLRKDEELKLADTIIVASRFTAKTLEEAPFPSASACVIPYACPTPVDPPHKRTKSNDTLKIIFVGSLTQRKGVADLLEAVAKTAPAVELTLIGRRVADCAPLDQALQTHRWIESLPHSEILREMGRHDVLLLPSIFEGFGLVITEALSQGIPVIATDHTCAPDLIESGREGYIVPIRSSDIIAEKLMRLHDNPDLLEEMKTHALRRASDQNMEIYSQQIIECILSRLKE